MDEAALTRPIAAIAFFNRELSASGVEVSPAALTWRLHLASLELKYSDQPNPGAIEYLRRLAAAEQQRLARATSNEASAGTTDVLAWIMTSLLCPEYTPLVGPSLEKPADKDLYYLARLANALEFGQDDIRCAGDNTIQTVLDEKVPIGSPFLRSEIAQDLTASLIEQLCLRRMKENGETCWTELSANTTDQLHALLETWLGKLAPASLRQLLSQLPDPESVRGFFKSIQQQDRPFANPDLLPYLHGWLAFLETQESPSLSGFATIAKWKMDFGFPYDDNYHRSVIKPALACLSNAQATPAEVYSSGALRAGRGF